MGSRTELSAIAGASEEHRAITEFEKEQVLRELENILNSPSFRSSTRCRQFLSYVVRQRLAGNIELLKERSIGAELFQRPSGYATGDDPVVRVQAGEVRRRLEQYYHSAPVSPMRIMLPVGTYVPQFAKGALQTSPASPHSSSGSTAFPAGTLGMAIPDVVEPDSAKLIAARPDRRFLLGLTIALIFTLAAAVAVIAVRSAKQRESVLEKFWSPIFSTPQAALICVEKPIVYRPSIEVYRKYSTTHPHTFQTEVERNTLDLTLDPKQKLQWGDFEVTDDFGIAVGDVQVVARLSALFAELKKPSQVRIGKSFSFEDLRNSPSVLVGAFNNRWTLQLTANLHFVFEDENGVSRIREQGPTGKTWYFQKDAKGNVVEDFAVVTRVLDAKTGQLLIAVAGIGDNGTRSAGELVSRPELLQEALKTAPADWQKKNMQILLATSVTDFSPGPPRILSIYFW